MYRCLTRICLKTDRKDDDRTTYEHIRSTKFVTKTALTNPNFEFVRRRIPNSSLTFLCIFEKGDSLHISNAHAPPWRIAVAYERSFRHLRLFHKKLREQDDFFYFNGVRSCLQSWKSRKKFGFHHREFRPPPCRIVVD